jgi:hypothetical protein
MINSTDLNKEMYIGHMEVWKKNLEAPKKESWRDYATIMKSTKMEETYETLGNLPAAKVTAPGASIEYGKMQDAYETTVKNEKVTNGFSIDLETNDDDQYNVKADLVNDLYSTMITLREKAVAAKWNGVFTVVGADGKVSAANDHPLKGTSAVNDNLASGTLTPDNIIAADNMFNSIKKHNGDVFDTSATAILAHKDKGALIKSILESTLRAQEASNTKNTVPSLKVILSKYLSAAPWHLIDENIASVIMQIRQGLKTHSEFDAKDTLVWYFNAYERYKAAIIHDGFGFVSSLGV